VIEIRELTARDARFQRRMLADAALWNGNKTHIPRFVLLRLNVLAMYHRGWGRPGDVGYVAEENGKRIGAVWYRLFTEVEHGEGYVDPETPELAIAVVKSARGKGVGRALMERIHERARADGLKQIAPSVNADNPAKRLYASLGYVDLAPDDPGERMVLRLAEE